MTLDMFSPFSNRLKDLDFTQNHLKIKCIFFNFLTKFEFS